MNAWFLSLRIDKAPFLIGITVLAIVGALLIAGRRPSRTWLLVVASALAGGAGIGFIVAWLVSDVFDVFGLPLTFVTRVWVALCCAGIALSIVGLWRARWWRAVIAVLFIPVFIATASAWINVDFGAYRNPQDALGINVYPQANLAHQTGTDTPQDPQLAQDWRPPTDMPAKGTVGMVKIPAIRSHFDAREAALYLPPAALVAHPPVLPVVEMFSGQPGAPADMFETARIAVYLNEYAAAHKGLAPIVVVPDQLSKPEHNPMCVDSPLGNSATYLMTDVPNWIRSHLSVGTTRTSWAIGGYSQGGTCAMQFGAGHPDRFGSILDIAGEVAPTIGAQTVKKGFGGSQAAYAAASPLSLLTKNAPFTATYGIFGFGHDDTEYGPGLKQMHAAAAAVGMHTVLIQSPHSAHDWNTVRYVLQRALRLLSDHLGLAQ